MSEKLKISILKMDGQKAGELEVSPTFLVDGHKGEQALHDTVVAQLANRRRGTASTLTMGEVRGSGKKPWRQKGTGRARAGSFASPLWRGGGVVFGPKPRDWSQRLTRKVKRLGLRRALSDRLRAGEVMLVEDLKVSSSKTKEFVSWLKKLGFEDSVLILVSSPDKNLHLASRNVPWVGVSHPESLNTYDVLRFRRLLFTSEAFEKLGKRLTAAE